MIRAWMTSHPYAEPPRARFADGCHFGRPPWLLNHLTVRGLELQYLKSEPSFQPPRVGNNRGALCYEACSHYRYLALIRTSFLILRLKLNPLNCGLAQFSRSHLRVCGAENRGSRNDDFHSSSYHLFYICPVNTAVDFNSRP